MSKACFIILSLLLSFVASAQVKIECGGFVYSVNDKTPLSQTNITIQQLNSANEKQIVAFGFSKANGMFSVKVNLYDSCSYVIVASHIGYETQEKQIRFSNNDTVIVFDFFLTPSKNQLKEIIIENKEPVKIKKDTIEFKADSFRTPQTRKVEDLIRNIEGFKVEADGRITYRGKEVKALLLDGDDLTQDQYQLLTRNLNADMVDKLQVIDNYNKNRIMGGLLESNQAAINLKLKKGMQGKLNGSASAAASPEGRYEADATLVWLKSKFKMVYLFNGNNIAKDATGLLRYQEFGSSAGMQQKEELTKKIMNGPGLITTGVVAAPDITREYVLNNRNWFTSPLFHVRISKSVKLAARIYALNDALFFNGGNSSNTIIDAQNQWSLNNAQESNRKRKNISAAVELSHDNLKRFAGNFNLQWGWVNDRNFFLNKTNGFFTDTLSETASANRQGYAGLYNGAIKINDYKVLNIQSNFSYLPEFKKLETQTNRLHLFYQIADSFRLFHEMTDANDANWQNSISLFHKKGRTTFKLGYENSWQKLQVMNDVTGSNKLLSSADRSISFFENKASFLTARQLSGKSSVRLTVNGGTASVVNRETAKESASYFLWKINTGYTYKLKAFSGFNFLLGSAKELPNLLMFHPANMISANASVLSGAKTVVPVEYYSATVSFSNFKIMSKFSLLISFNARYGKTDYVGNSLLLPQYNITTWGPVHNNRQAGVNFDIGSFIFPLNSTFRLSSNANFSISNQLQNNKKVQNNSKFGGFTVTWVPSFKIPVGWQVDFSKSFFYNEQLNGSQSLKNNNHTTNLLIKLRSNFSTNYYIGSQYNYLQLSPQQKFHLWSIFQNVVISKKWNADLVIHNLLNNQRYVERNNSPNSISENTFMGVGRYFLVRMNWSF
ncbi:MAG: hypothetical protein ABL872_08310 [Lacibacter sp.]